MKPGTIIMWEQKATKPRPPIPDNPEAKAYRWYLRTGVVTHEDGTTKPIEFNKQSHLCNPNHGGQRYRGPTPVDPHNIDPSTPVGRKLLQVQQEVTRASEPGTPHPDPRQGQTPG